MSMDRANARHEEQLEHEQEDYQKRQEEYKENSRSDRASHIYETKHTPEKRQVASATYQQLRPAAGLGPDTNETESAPDRQPVASATYQQYRPAAGLGTDSIDQRPHTRRLHDSHFLLGNQTHLQEEGGSHKEPNQKFSDRYANKSLEMTNVSETAGLQLNEGENLDDNDSESEITAEQANESHRSDNEASQAKEDEEHEQTEDQQQQQREADEQAYKNDQAHGSGSSMNENASSDSGNRNLQSLNEDEVDKSEQRDIDREVGAKASAGITDHRHFESEKSMPWLRMIPGDKNLSEQMFLYLTHNELKGQIQDLEKRESQAASKHQWDEALRLRDMRNRLDLAREKNLYRRDDLLLDPEVKKIGMAGIEARSKLLKKREMLCTNSSMYSEEAKVMWNEWLVEDQNSVLEGARHQREDLMKQLEENWRSLAIEDKQRISDSFNKEVIDAALQNDQDNLCALRSASR